MFSLARGALTEVVRDKARGALTEVVPDKARGAISEVVLDQLEPVFMNKHKFIQPLISCGWHREESIITMTSLRLTAHA